jgi:hypothetical protein
MRPTDWPERSRFDRQLPCGGSSINERTLLDDFSIFITVLAEW